jgi:hypothetical protein
MSTGGVVPGGTVDRSGKVLVLPVPDGVEKEDGPAAGSGQAVYAAIRDTLIAKGVSVTTTDQSQLPAGFQQAEELGCRYMLKATIPEWEDNATEWSAKPDVAAVSVELFEVGNRSLAASASHRVASSSGQMFSRRPERFVPELVDQALAKIFGWPASVVTPK